MFLVQHGWGNGDGGGNVGRALAAGDAAGVIWSACNYVPASLRSELKRNAGAVQMLDPQLYVAYAPGDIKMLQLDDYPWISMTRDAQGRLRQITPAVVAQSVAAALQFQLGESELTEVVAPARAISSGAGVQLNLIQAFAGCAVTWWRSNGDERPLFVSAPVEAALLDDGLQQERLAVAGALVRSGADGVYLLVELDPALDDATYSTRLENALWMVNRLSQEMRVRVGYTGLNGWIFRAAGAEATAAGWFQNRRYWSLRHWIKRSGGSRLERVALLPPFAMLTPADLAAVRDANLNLYTQLLGNVGPLANRLARSPATAGAPISLEAHAAQLFAVCQHLDAAVGSNFRTDARQIIADVAAAETLRTAVAAAALTIEGAATDGRPEQWETALHGLANRLNISL